MARVSVATAPIAVAAATSAPKTTPQKNPQTATAPVVAVTGTEAMATAAVPTAMTAIAGTALGDIGVSVLHQRVDRDHQIHANLRRLRQLQVYSGLYRQFGPLSLSVFLRMLLS